MSTPHVKSRTFKWRGSRGELRLYQMDCIRGMQEHLEPGSVNVAVTSPPYNIGVKYKGYADTGPRTQYLDWLDDWAKVVKQVLADDGLLFLNMGAKPTDPWVPFDVLAVMRKHFTLQNVIHWIKSIAIEKADVGNYPNLLDDIVVGHYKPVNSPRFLNDCQEYVFHLTKTGEVEIDRIAIGVKYQDKSNIRRWRTVGRDRHCRGNTWFIPYRTIQSRDKERPHPATFPPELPEMCIALHGVKNARLVMDPFTGLGNTAIAARRLGRSFVGFEIAEDYFAEAWTRIEAEGEGLLGAQPSHRIHLEEDG